MVQQKSSPLTMQKDEYRLFFTNSSPIFPGNRPSEFVVPLFIPIDLTNATWKVALMEIAVENTGSKEKIQGQPMLIYSNICESTMHGRSVDPLLAVTFMNMNESELAHAPIKPPHYTTAVKETINNLRFELRIEAGKPFPLKAEAKIYLILHLKKL